MSRAGRQSPIPIFVALLAFVMPGVSPLHAATELQPGRAPAGVYAGLAKEKPFLECAASANTPISAFVRALDVTSVRLPNIGSMYTASGEGPCLNGAHNTLVVGLMSSDGKSYRHVFQDEIYGELKVGADGSITTLANDGASVSIRTTYVYDGSVYRAARAERVFLPTGETKPLSIPVRFAPGSSSATVTGKVYLAFEDDYTLDAAAGQIMSIDVRPTSGAVGLPSLYAVGPDREETLTVSSLPWRGKLPVTGTYHLAIGAAYSDKLRDTGFDRPSTYTMTISIH